MSNKEWNEMTIFERYNISEMGARLNDKTEDGAFIGKPIYKDEINESRLFDFVESAFEEVVTAEEIKNYISDFSCFADEDSCFVVQSEDGTFFSAYVIEDIFTDEEYESLANELNNE